MNLHSMLRPVTALPLSNGIPDPRWVPCSVTCCATMSPSPTMWCCSMRTGPRSSSMLLRIARSPARPWGPAAWFTMSSATTSSSTLSSPTCCRRNISWTTSRGVLLVTPASISARRLELPHADPPLRAQKGSARRSAAELGPIDEFLDVAIERPGLRKLEVEVDIASEHRVGTGRSRDHGKNRYLDEVDQTSRHECPVQ